MSTLIAASLRHRILVLIVFLMMIGAGVGAFLNLNIEAYPDPVPPLVDIVTQTPGQSSEEIERNITIPIEIQMAGIPHVTAIRTISLFGLSDVKVQFTYDFTYDEAEQWVINRLSQLPTLPNNAQPQISPESPIGEIYRYRIVAPKGFSVTDLKTMQDWILQRRFKALPGVIDVIGWGGALKTYEVTVDPNRLTNVGLTLPQMLQALNNSNVNVGGQTVNIGPQSMVVRGIGLVDSMDDIRNTVLASTNGMPVFVRDVATVSPGMQPRLGIAGQDGDDDILQGIVLMRRGQHSKETIKRIEQEVDYINSHDVLPPGVGLEKIYDRLDLITLTTNTVFHNLILGIVLIFLIQWVFLENLKSALVVSCTIPFALFFAVIIMAVRGESANLLSVGAIDFGLIVDASVIMMENIFRRVAEGGNGTPLAQAAAPPGLPERLKTHYFAALEVARSIFFAAAIIIVGFVPLFTLSGIEGHIFAPMAKTYAYALLGGLIASFTIIPAFSALFMDEKIHEGENLVLRVLRRAYRPAVEFALTRRFLTLSLAGLVFAAASLTANTLGLEFLPKLEEGNFWIRGTLPRSISLEEAQPYVNRMRAVIGSYPEVRTVVSQLGRPADGTDAAGFNNVEFYVPLKPRDEWPAGLDKEALTKLVNERLLAEFPGVDFNFSQNIQDNVEEAASGVKGENSVKIFGPDLATLEKTASKIKEVLATVKGIEDLSIFGSLGQPNLSIKVNRAQAARYGLAAGDVNAVIQAAIGGQAAGELYEKGSDRHFPILVRLDKRYRENIQAIRNISIGVNGQSGSTYIPLSQLADINLTSGPFYIYREHQERYLPIKFSVRGRHLGGAVLEAQKKVNNEVALPGGYHIEWVGEFGNLQDALARLRIIVPVTILLIGILLYFNFESLTDTLIAMSVIPMAMTGGIFALSWTNTSFSVSAAVGFIALFGISAMEGILIISYYNRLLQTGMQKAEAIRESCRLRLRPVLMTCVAACVGLLPAAFSTGIGSQVQRPLAIVVVGGMLLAPFLILVILPAAIDVFSRAHRQAEAAEAPALPAE
ncbi:MAG: CusA/CzcA family heavy metal efflux RND transporter [Rhodomicrobium sp.]